MIINFNMILNAFICMYIILVLIKLILKCTNRKCKSKKELTGKVAIVTGGNSGVGFEVAKDLAIRGCKVIIADVANAVNSVENIINASNNPNVIYKYLDLGSLQSVRNFVVDFKNNEKRLDILINNAGVAGFNNIFTSDKLLKVMQINHLGPFLLTYLLTDLIKLTPKSRIVFTSTFCISSLIFNHTLTPKSINSVPPYNNTFANSIVAYKNSKLCNMISAKVFGKKLEKYGILCNSVHPGFIKSNLSKTFEDSISGCSLLPRFLTDFLYDVFAKTPIEAAQTTLHCALVDVNVTGQFFVECREWSIRPKVYYDDEFCENIFNESLKLVGITKEDVMCADINNN